MKLENTPRARIGLLIALVAGLAFALMLWSETTSSYRSLGHILERVLLEWNSSYVRRYRGEKLTLLLCIIGLMLSYFYPYTLGPLLRWIRDGKTPRDR
jgi:hypothetical protein